jgi:hypothetical protein
LGVEWWTGVVGQTSFLIVSAVMRGFQGDLLVSSFNYKVNRAGGAAVWQYVAISISQMSTRIAYQVVICWESDGLEVGEEYRSRCYQ